MHVSKRGMFSVFLGLSVATTTGLMAHTTVMPKNTPAGWGERSELEGTTSFSSLAVAHGCAAEGSHHYQPVTAMAVVWPNGFYAEAVREDNGEAVDLSLEIVGNAVMRPVPVKNHDIFRTILVGEAEVPTFESHGTNTTDNRAFHYKNGELETYLVGSVPYRITNPTFQPESCVTAMKVNFAIANYCTNSATDGDRADIWMGKLTTKFSDPAVVSVGSWPNYTVVRDLENNPLPEECEGGYTISVTPSSEALDQFLPVRGYWPNETSERKGRSRH